MIFPSRMRAENEDWRSFRKVSKYKFQFEIYRNHGARTDPGFDSLSFGGFDEPVFFYVLFKGK